MATLTPLVFILTGCTTEPYQLPLGGDRGCSYCVDSIAPACWSAHDDAYWVGGTEQDRFLADAEFLACMALHGMPEVWATGRYRILRSAGESSWNLTERRTRGPARNK